MTLPSPDPSLSELFELFRDPPLGSPLAPREKRGPSNDVGRANRFPLAERDGYTQPIEPPPFEVVTAAELPPDFRRLLEHENHMTLALEQFHGRPVQLHVQSVRHRGDDYARMILLSLEGTDRIVEFGIVLIKLSFLNDDVRAEILAATTPLGRVLIEHDVLRRISPTHFLRITPNARLMQWFGMTAPETVYGRLATILCDGLPAIDLLEVVRV